MATEAELSYLIKVNDRDLNDLKKRIKETNQAIGEGEGAANRKAKAMAVLGKATVPAVAALGLIAVGVKKATDSASNLNESVNATKVVFGDAAGKISAFSKIAAGEAGLSMRAFNELVTPVGASLQNVGFSADQAADASISLAKRAADMASVFNVDVSEALGAIQSGLRGEADPLEKFGVGLSDAAVKSQALTMGLAKTEKELTANDKAQARLKLIMDQSNRVAGDFKNTSDSLANAQRINAAEAENQKAKFGQGLLPIMETYQKLISSATTFLGEHSGATKVAVGVVAALALGVLAVNGAVKVYQATLVAAKAAQAIFNATMAMNPIGLVIIALVALGAGLVVAYQKSETFRNIVNGVFNAVKDTIATVIAAILTGVDKFLGGIQMIAEAASKLPFVGDKFKGVAEAVGNAREKVQGLRDDIESLKSKSITISTTIEKVYKERTEVLPGAPIGRRAHGGPVNAGSPYLVGERGMELFVPKTAGHVIPNGALTSAGGRALSRASNVFVNVTVEGNVTAEEDLAEKIRQALVRKGERNLGVGLA